MGIELILTSGIVATLVEQAAKVAPLEACGLLLGTRGAGGGERICAAAPAANIAPDPVRHFEIDPAALIAAHRAERSGGPEIIGYYHSHPTGSCLPSPTDAAMACGDGRVWAIIGGGIGAGQVRFWRDAPGGFIPLSTQADDG